MNEKIITCTIDGKQISVPTGTTVYQACKQLGIDIPIFCYQDRMPPFGACRVCLVQVENMPKLQSSCTLTATDGMVIHTQSDSAAKGRKEILEFLLINHPLDCPICDRAGECPLQDQVYSDGPGKSRFYEEKRRFKKHLSLGPLLVLDRERCISCARCTRFSDDLSGDHALEFKERGYKTEIGTPDGGPVKSKFIGNTIMICPVGALTSDVYRFRARPWDNQVTQSTCTLCPVGCSLYLDQRDGEIVRTRALENRAINDIWLCDKGWFGYEFTESPERLHAPLIKENGAFREASWDEALCLAAEKLKQASALKQLAGLGGNNLTIEENFFFHALLGDPGKRAFINSHSFNTPKNAKPGMRISFEECENLDCILLFGIDVTEEFPLLWLRLRQAINKGAKVFFLGHYAPEIAPYFTEVILHPPGEEVSHIKQFAEKHESLLAQSKKAALFIGKQYLSHIQSEAIFDASLRVKESFPAISLNVMQAEGNSLGASFAAHYFSPASQKEESEPSVLETIEKAPWELLYIAGYNVAKKYSSKSWKKVSENTQFLIVQDLFLTETAKEADLVLPVLSHLEKEGSFLTISGQIQTIRPGRKVPDHLLSDSEIFRKLARKMGKDVSLSKELKELLKQKSVSFGSEQNGADKAIKQPPIKGLKASFQPLLFDDGVRMTKNSHLSQVDRPAAFSIHPKEAEKLGIQNRANIQIKINGTTIEAPLKLSESVAEETIVIPVGLDAVPTYEIGAPLENGLSVEIII